MGKRREPRKTVQVPVRIFGTDVDGKIFSEKVTTATVSNNGVRLDGVRARLNIDEIVGLTVRKQQSPLPGQMGGHPRNTDRGRTRLGEFDPGTADVGLPPAAPRIRQFSRRLAGRPQKFAAGQMRGFRGVEGRGRADHVGQSHRPQYWRLFCGDANPVTTGRQVRDRPLDLRHKVKGPSSCCQQRAGIRNWHPVHRSFPTGQRTATQFHRHHPPGKLVRRQFPWGGCELLRSCSCRQTLRPAPAAMRSHVQGQF